LLRCPAPIFQWTLRRSSPAVTEDDVRALRIEKASELCRELLDGGAPGLHFYIRPVNGNA
jgi:hypothetical protein